MRAVLLVTVLTLTGCADMSANQPHYVWSKPGAQPGEFERTKYQCLRENNLTYEMNVLFSECLAAHGWREVIQP